MKYLFNFILVFTLTTPVIGQELVPVMGPLIPVTPTNANGSTRPRIVLVQDSVPLVVWTKTGSGNGIVYSSRWNGTGFDPAVQVSPSGLNVYCSADEGGDVAARGDTAFVVFFTTDSKTYAVRSVDGGFTWGDTVRVDHQTVFTAYTPDVQILPGGNPVVVFESSDLSFGNTRELVCRSADGGLTFNMETEAQLAAPGRPCECCPPALLVNDSMVYVIYRNNVSNIRDIVMTISSDSGNTFPVLSEVDQQNWNLTSCPTAGPAGMFYRDSVLVAWKSGYKIYFGCAHAMTGAEGPDTLLEPSLASSIIQKHPSVCGSGDTIVFTWSDRRTTSYDVYIAISGSGPQQLDTVFRFNDTTGTAENGTQQTPHAVYNSGIIHLVYQDLATGKIIYRNAMVGGVVGIREEQVQPQITLYPNPVTDEVNIVLPSQGTGYFAKIYSIGGELVSVTAISNPDSRIDCSYLVPGTYILEISDMNGNQFSSYFIRK